METVFPTIPEANESSVTLVKLTTLVGILAVSLFSVKLLIAIHKAFKLYVLSQSSGPGDTLKYGQWAVITGATDGIGQSMAKEFARRGHSILVIGRNKEKLARTKELLEREPNVGQVETLKIDLSDSSLENYARIEGQLDANNRDIGILVNNAGMTGDVFQRFVKFDLKTLHDTVNVNIMAPVLFTRLVLSGMVARQRGLVVSVSSIGGSFSIPYMGVYTASKTFINRFSKLLQLEYASHPIDFITLKPGWVYTKLYTCTQVARPPKSGFIRPSPDEYARSALNAISAGESSFAGTWDHELIRSLFPIVEYCGLSAKVWTLTLRHNIRQFQLSPVPRRKSSELLGDSLKSSRNVSTRAS